MTTQPKTTEAENPYLTREDALAILNTPDDQLDEQLPLLAFVRMWIPTLSPLYLRRSFSARAISSSN